MRRIGRCPYPRPGERYRHVLPTGELAYAELAEPVRLAMSPGSGTSPRLRVGDCPVLAGYDQRADLCRAPGMGQSPL
jgi:hypothetical protein